MRPTNQVAWSVTLVSPAKTVEPIKMPFGLWAQYHVVDRGPEVLRDVAMATNFCFYWAVTLVA